MKLNNNLEMPEIGLGTFLLEPKDAYNSVKEALNMGYRLIDTANAYVNERSVGRAIKDSGVERKNIFVSTKLWASEYNNPNAVSETLERLGLDYIDLLFIHQPTKNWREGYKMLVNAYKKGLIRSIGISNFEGQIEDVLNEYDTLPQVIQVECHPNWPQTDLRKITDSHEIKIMSWYPLGGKGNTDALLTNPVIVELAKKYDKSSAQIVLRWHIDMGFIVIPGSKNVNHIKENLDVLSFKLTKDDMDRISSISNNKRIYEPEASKLEMYAAWQLEYEKE